MLRRIPRSLVAAIAIAIAFVVGLVDGSPDPAHNVPVAGAEHIDGNAWTWDEPRYGHLEREGFAVVDGESMRIDGALVADRASALETIDASSIGYNRDLFPHWSDLDGDGRDTRNDVLLRDLTETTLFREGRTVATGTLHDPYTSARIDFQHTNYPEADAGDSSTVQIDHLVPLSAAWTGGANVWSPAQRESFANDPINLLAVDGNANQRKSDMLPGEWMPDNDAYHCVYVALIVTVLDGYELAVTSLDRAAMVEIAETCVIETAPGADATEAAGAGSGADDHGTALDSARAVFFTVIAVTVLTLMVAGAIVAVVVLRRHCRR